MVLCSIPDNQPTYTDYNKDQQGGNPHHLRDVRSTPHQVLGTYMAGYVGIIGNSTPWCAFYPNILCMHPIYIYFSLPKQAQSVARIVLFLLRTSIMRGQGFQLSVACATIVYVGCSVIRFLVQLYFPPPHDSGD